MRTNSVLTPRKQGAVHYFAMGKNSLFKPSYLFNDPRNFPQKQIFPENIWQLQIYSVSLHRFPKEQL